MADNADNKTEREKLNYADRATLQLPNYDSSYKCDCLIRQCDVVLVSWIKIQFYLEEKKNWNRSLQTHTHTHNLKLTKTRTP